MRVEFAVEGAPVAKARARVVRGRAYTPEATKGYEERVTAGALNAINLGGLVMPSPREPVKANVSIGIPMPVSWSGRRKRREQRTAHTQRPDIDNLVKVILDGCKGDVYDPFVGSGTTIIAAERQGRACYAMEVEPRYADMAIARWVQYTGGKAEVL